MLQATYAGRYPSCLAQAQCGLRSLLALPPYAASTYYVTVRTITATASGRASHIVVRWRLEACRLFISRKARLHEQCNSGHGSAVPELVELRVPRRATSRLRSQGENEVLFNY